MLLKRGDRVAINGRENDVGVVAQVHQHEVVVRLENGAHERLALESVRLLPTMDEASGFVDR